MSSEIEAVVFDLGGVLVELGSFEAMFGPSQLESADIAEYWLGSEVVRRHECGKCTVDEFAAELHRDLGLAGTVGDFIDRFLALPKGLFPESVAVVESANHLTTAILSNTNKAHTDNARHAATLNALFDRHYRSFELGLIKPDREIFDYVIADLDLAPRSVLFLDDNQINIDGARQAGWTAALVRGPAEVAAVLRDHGVTT